MPVDFALETIRGTRSVVAATWPEMGPSGTPNEHGIWEVEHVLQVPWTELVPPYAVIVADEFDRDEELSGVVDVFRVQIGVYYVGQFSGALTQLRPKLLALRRALNTVAIETLQVVSVDKLSTSENLTPNQIFLSTKNDAFRAGYVEFTTLTGAHVRS